MENDYGICPINAAWMFYASSGFGYGEFKMFPLKSGDDVCGVEVEMIAPGTPYPF
jgi:hypothetical protein